MIGRIIGSIIFGLGIAISLPGLGIALLGVKMLPKKSLTRIYFERRERENEDWLNERSK